LLFQANNAREFHLKIYIIFKNFQMNPQELDLVQQWVNINKKLEEGWAPFRELAGSREEIENQLPFLKNKGVSPYPPKPAKEKSSSSSILLDRPSSSSPPPAKKAKTGTTEKGAKAALNKVKNQGTSSSPSKSSLGLNEDNSQSFQGNQ
jgi:hypothetical protein